MIVLPAVGCWCAIAIIVVGLWAIAMRSQTVGAPWNRYDRCPSCGLLWKDCCCTEEYEVRPDQDPTAPERIAQREWN